MKAGLLLVAQPSCESDSLCQPGFGSTGVPAVSVTLPEIVPSAAACNECEITPDWPAPPRSQIATGAGRPRPLDREHVLSRIRAGRGIARARASPAAAVRRAPASSTTTSHSRRRALRARSRPLRQQQRMRAVAARPEPRRRPGCRRRRTAAMTSTPGSPTRARVQRAAPHTAQHGERHLRRGLKDVRARPRADHRGRRRRRRPLVSSADAMTSTSGNPVAPAGGRNDRSGVGPAASGSSRSGGRRPPAGPRANSTTLRPAPAFSAPAAGANSARAGTTSRSWRALVQASCVLTSAVSLSIARRIG